MKEQLLQSWWLIALSISSGVAGQTAIKIGVNQPGSSAASSGIFSLVRMILGSPLVLIGLLLYGIGALAWIAVLSRMDLSYAYPFLALNFVLITLVSVLFLGESVPGIRWFGLAFICVGIVLVAQGTTSPG
jgi:drug/metabolite transporter (DMT)-like permease